MQLVGRVKRPMSYKMSEVYAISRKLHLVFDTQVLRFAEHGPISPRNFG